MNPRDAEPPLPTRRDFGCSLAVGGVFALASGTAAAREAGETVPVADSLLAIARARYGKHLTAEQLERLGRSLKRGLTRAEEIKRVPLTNADDPAAAFRADLP